MGEFQNFFCSCGHVNVKFTGASSLYTLSLVWVSVDFFYFFCSPEDVEKFKLKYIFIIDCEDEEVFLKKKKIYITLYVDNLSGKEVF